MNNMIN